MSKIIVRNYQPQDAKYLADIYYNTIHKINAQDYSKEQINAWAPKLSNLDSWRKKWQKITPLVATINNQIVGFAEFENNGHIDCFYVHHKFQNQKIGSALLNEIEKISKQKYLPKIYAEVSITAKDFFEHKGFKILKKQSVSLRDVKLDNFIMEKKYNNWVIETDNFYLRPFHETYDFDLSYGLWTDKDVLESMEYEACTKEDIKRKLALYKSWMDKLGCTNFAVFTKASNDFVGSCGFSLFHDPDNDRNPLTPNESSSQDIELGYVLHKKYWGKGYATELAKACVNFVFNSDLNAQRIVAVTVPNNIASQNVLAKTGFQFIKDINSKEYGKEKFFVMNFNQEA